jgi:probable phosphoglycerate mutase
MPDETTMVLFVRHGLTATTGKVLYGRSPDVHLSEDGHNQAAHVAARLEKLAPIAALYASPLDRTRETAAPIAAALGLETTIDDRLIEADFGEWTNRDLAELFKLPEWNQVQRSPSTFRFPNGESFTEMQTRMTDATVELATRHRGQRIVLVSHADPIKAAVTHFAGTHLDLFQRTVISPCSISSVLLAPSDSPNAATPTLLAVNSTGDDLSGLVPA